MKPVSALVSSVRLASVRVIRKRCAPGAFWFADLVRYRLQVGAHPEGMDAHEYLTTIFMDGLRGCLKAGGTVKKNGDVEEAADNATALVGYRGRLFTVFCDYQVSKNRAPFAAIGCGANFGGALC